VRRRRRNDSILPNHRAESNGDAYDGGKRNADSVPDTGGHANGNGHIHGYQCTASSSLRLQRHDQSSAL
jgi:hypothetical protein